MNEIRIPSGQVNIEFPAESMDVCVDMAEEPALENITNPPPVEGIFAAECILKKRTRKVRIFAVEALSLSYGFLTGKIS